MRYHRITQEGCKHKKVDNRKTKIKTWGLSSTFLGAVGKRKEKTYFIIRKLENFFLRVSNETDGVKESKGLNYLQWNVSIQKYESWKISWKDIFKTKAIHVNIKIRC